MEEDEQKKECRTTKDVGRPCAKQKEVIIGSMVEDVIDLSVDFAWTSIEMDDEEESNGEEQEVEDVADLPRTLSFCEKMKRLSPHCLPLKERMKDCTISYVDLLCPDPLPPRSKDDLVPRGSRRLPQQKHK